MSVSDGGVWMLCSACRKAIAFRQIHWVCSVSTCNRNRMRLVFCSVACWDSHLSTIRHREAWAVEATAPSREEHAREEADAAETPRCAVTVDRALAPRPAVSAPPRATSAAGGAFFRFRRLRHGARRRASAVEHLRAR